MISYTKDIHCENSKKRKFIQYFSQIFECIAKGKFLATKHFKETLYDKFKNLKTFPKCIESQFISKMKTIDLIYQGYTIIYKIEKDKNYT